MSVFCSGLSKIWSKLSLITFLFGLWLPASFESDNREASNFLILFLVLLEFCHKALTFASLLLILYEISFRSYRTDYSFVTFFGCWAFIWIPIPTLFHQLFPEGWRRLATLPVNWTVTLIHPLKEILKCFSRSVSKGLLCVPHLPHYQPQAVDVCLGVVDSGMTHFRCHINRCSCKSARDVYFCFGQAHVSNLYCVFFRQL